MPHEIENMAFAGVAPWHGLGTPLEAADTTDWRLACAKAGLDWDVQTVPLVTADKQEPVTHVAVRRSSDDRVLGVVGPRYVPVQNREAFEWFQPFLDGGEAKLETAGALRRGSRIWVLAKLNRAPLVIAPDDEVEKFILLSHAHDGSLAVRVGYTPIRVVCHNTLSMAHGDRASKLIRLRHSRSVRQNLVNVRAVMDTANAEFEATAEQYRLLVRKSINATDLKKYVRRVLKIEEGATPSTRLQNIADEIVGLAEAGRGNDLPSVRGTLWAAYNGASEYLGYNRGRTQANRLDSLWFGDAAATNRHALEVALDMAA